MNPIVQTMPKSLVAEEQPTGEEPLAKLRRDSRKSCRSTVPKERQACELKVGANVSSALLANESKHGFAVLIDRLNGLKIGKKAELHTDMGRFTVRIVYINKVGQPIDAAFQSDCWFRVGMKKARSFSLF
jgi:hypothetical protein